jgi:glucose/arabinose dehydrogenase
VNSDSERGLGIALIEGKTSATTTTNNNYTKFVFLYFTEPNGQDSIRNRVYRFEWHPQNQTLTSSTLILDLPAEPGPNHDGDKLEVDKSGNLYAVIGGLNRDGQLQNIRQGGPPDDTSVIIRIKPNGSAVEDNPFFNSTDERIKKYYAYGIRNSFGLAIDPISGLLWDTENGPNAYDEVNIVQPGFNSGWKKIMGPLSRTNMTQTEIAPELVNLNGSMYADPLFSWNDSIGLTDIEFLNSTALGFEYAYDIFVGDFNNGNLYHFKVNDTRTGIELSSNLTGLTDRMADNEQELSHIVFGTGFGGGITDIETGPDGLLYVLTLNGSLYRISPLDENDQELGQIPRNVGNIDRNNNNTSEAARSSNDNKENNLIHGESDSSSNSSDNPLSLRSLSGTNGGSPVLGSLDAPVTVVDFSDFQCPRCARYVKSTQPEIKKEYADTGKVALVFKHFPRLGSDSFSAALAS